MERVASAAGPAMYRTASQENDWSHQYKRNLFHFLVAPGGYMLRFVAVSSLVSP